MLAQRQVLEAMIAEDPTAQGYLATLPACPPLPSSHMSTPSCRSPALRQGACGFGSAGADAVASALVESLAQGMQTYQEAPQSLQNVSVASPSPTSMAPTPVLDPRTATPPPHAMGAPPVPAIWTTPKPCESPIGSSSTEPPFDGGAGPLAAWATQTPRQPRHCVAADALAAAPPTPAGTRTWEPPASLFYFCHLSEAALSGAQPAPPASASFLAPAVYAAPAPLPEALQARAQSAGSNVTAAPTQAVYSSAQLAAEACSFLSDWESSAEQLREKHAELSRLFNGQEEAAAARRRQNEAEATRLERRSADLEAELEAARQAEHSLRRELGRVRGKAPQATGGVFGPSSLPLRGPYGSSVGPSSLISGRGSSVGQSEPRGPLSPCPGCRPALEVPVLARG